MSRLSTLVIDDKGFAFDPATGTSYTLNPTATLLLRGLREGLDTTALTERLMADFPVERDRARQDVAEFAHDLSTLGLV